MLSSVCPWLHVLIAHAYLNEVINLTFFIEIVDAHQTADGPQFTDMCKRFQTAMSFNTKKKKN